MKDTKEGAETDGESKRPDSSLMQHSVFVCARAVNLCLFVCMNNSGPWRGQPAAVMRRTCIDTKYCWWEAIDPTAICPKFSRGAGTVCRRYSDGRTDGRAETHALHAPIEGTLITMAED